LINAVIWITKILIGIDLHAVIIFHSIESKNLSRFIVANRCKKQGGDKFKSNLS